MNTVLWNGWELAFPIKEWDGKTWYGGHYGSGREPSSAVYNPAENNRMHAGYDFGCPMRTPLLAIADGTVTDIGYNGGAGHYLVTRHESPWGQTYWYRALHIDHNGYNVAYGQPVKQGQTIAFAGSTGSSAAPHLHAELTTVPPYVHFTADRHVDIEYVFFKQPGRKGYQMVTAWQTVLHDYGWYDGPIDGIMGPKTQQALSRFAAEALDLPQHRHKNRPWPVRQTGWVSKEV